MTVMRDEKPVEWTNETPSNRIIVYVSNAEAAYKNAEAIKDEHPGCFAVRYFKTNVDDEPVEQVGLLLLVQGFSNPILFRWPAKKKEE